MALTLLSNKQGTCTNWTSNYKVYGRVWLVSQDARNNQSVVRIQLVNWSKSTGFAWEGNYLGGAFIRLDWTTHNYDWASGYCYSWDSNNEYVMMGGDYTIDHGTDGKKAINLWIHCKAPAGGYGPGTCYVESSGYAWDVTLPQIDRAASSISHSLNSVSTTSAVINVSTGQTCDSFQYSTDGGSTYKTASVSSGKYTISSLSANTTYSVYTKCRRSSNWVWNTSSKLTVQTHPNTVGCNTPSASASDPFTISVSVTSKDKNNTSKIRVYCGSLYKDITGGSGTVTFDKLTPETTYKIYATAYTVRSGATSNSGSVNVTTPADSFCYVINENGSKTGKHKMYLIDTNGTKTEVKKGNVKVL